MKIKFLGASKVVTGSCYLLETDHHKILIDCGLFQGSDELELLNNEPFDFNPALVDYVVLSHAHIDHSGRIPKLVKEGFKGKIISTKATKELCDIMLVDSGHIQESDAKWENKHRMRSGKPPIVPLYTASDASYSLKFFDPVLYNQKVKLNKEISVRFQDAGHILGSSIVELWITEREKTAKVVFSGDLGMKDKPILRNPAKVDFADYLIVESTYGNRLHKQVGESTKRLVEIINKTAARGGSVIIPSFAVSRTQELIYELNHYYEYNDDIQQFMRIPIYIDSPMAVSATEVYKNNSYCFNEAAKDLILGGDDPFKFENLFYVRSQSESMRLNEAPYPKVIISASGMCTAGRIRHHLRHNLWNKKNSVVFVGYQAEGTLGRRLKDGIKKVKVLGEEVSVEAEIYSIEGFSGHADKNGLIDFVESFEKIPKKIFVTHGEESSSNDFAQYLRETHHVKAIVPDIGFTFELKEHVKTYQHGTQLESIRRKENIQKELQTAYSQFENLASNTDKMMDQSLLSDHYDSLKNKIIDLQQKLMDITIMLGK